MDEDPIIPYSSKTRPDLEDHLKFLNLSFMQNHFEPLADQAARARLVPCRLPFGPGRWRGSLTP